MAGTASVAFAAIVGGATGFGSALIGTPLMLLAGVDLPIAVAMNLAAGSVTRAIVAVQLRSMMVVMCSVASSRPRHRSAARRRCC